MYRIISHPEKKLCLACGQSVPAEKQVVATGIFARNVAEEMVVSLRNQNDLERKGAPMLYYEIEEEA